MAMLQPSYKLSVGVNVLPRMVAVGKFDGKFPALAFGTVGNRVAVFSPHTHTEDSKVELRYLNINRELKALHSGRLDASSASDLLFVGSETHILAYNVEENRDAYLREISCGLSSITVGNVVPGDDNALCLVGGNCSIEGFDHKGDEQVSYSKHRDRTVNGCHSLQAHSSGRSLAMLSAPWKSVISTGTVRTS